MLQIRHPTTGRDPRCSVRRWLRGEARGALLLLARSGGALIKARRSCVVVCSTTVFITSNSCCAPSKRPRQRSLFGDLTRIFEDIAESGNKVTPAASVQIGERF